VRAAGGTPVLVTPLTRRTFKGRQLANDLQPWADADQVVAAAKQAPLVDLFTASAAAVQAMGSAEADTLAVEPPSSMQAAQADRNQLEAVTNKKSAFDHTHVGPKGADFFATLMVQLLRNDLPALTPYLR
ncbi:MAG: hydrolase, partial [Betaproteobacteria bacterium]